MRNVIMMGYYRGAVNIFTGSIYPFFVHVTSVAFSPDGTCLLSGSWDNTVQVWDAASGACLEIIPETVDIAAIAAGAARIPYRALPRGLETVIERSSNGQPIIFFATSLFNITTHPNCRTWAGVHGEFLEIFTLEGNPEL